MPAARWVSVPFWAHIPARSHILAVRRTTRRRGPLMARLLFITLYDEYNLGIRQLVANLRQQNHEAYLLCVKPYGRRLLRDGDVPRDEGQVELLPNGSRSVLCYPFEITEAEYELMGGLMKRLKPDAVGLSAYSPQI